MTCLPIATQAEAEAGTVNDKVMTPLRVKQAIDVLGVSQDALAAPTGGEMVGFQQSGDDAVESDIRAKTAQIVTDRDFTTGLVGALAAVRNNNDNSFSGAVSIPNGFVTINDALPLPQTFSRIYGNGGGTYWQFGAEPVFDGSSTAHVGNQFDNFRTYAGTHVFDISTGGEIASNVYTRLTMTLFTGDAFRFAGGVTSSLFADGVSEAINGDHGIYSGGGINNDNRVRGWQFLNLTKPAIKTLGLTQGLYVDARVEGNGQPGEAVYDLSGAAGVRISGWKEAHHEYLLRLASSGGSTGDDGVTLDGVIDAGAKDGGALKASLFDVGARRVIFGSNVFFNPTAAPARCFVYGVNKNLSTDASVVHTRAIPSSEFVVAKKRTNGAATFDFLTFTRPDTTDVSTNQQVVSGTIYVTFSGYNSVGVPCWGVWEVEFSIHAIGNLIDDPNIGITSTLKTGNAAAAGVNLTVQKRGSVTSAATTLEMVFSNIASPMPGVIDNYVQYELSCRNLSSTEARRAVVNIL